MTDPAEKTAAPVIDLPETDLAEQQNVKTTSAFLSPVSRIRTSTIVQPAEENHSDSSNSQEEKKETGLPTGGAGASTLSSLLRAGGARLAVDFPEHEESDVEQVQTLGAESEIRTEVHTDAKKKKEEKEEIQPPVVGSAPGPLNLAKKIASMLRPGPPFFSEMDNSDLVGYIGDAKVMNGEGGGGAAATVSEAGMTATPPVMSHQSVWAALDSLPVGAGWTQIPTNLAVGGDEDAISVNRPVPGGPEGDDGLWTSLMLTCDLPSFLTASSGGGDAGISASGSEVLDMSGMKVELGQSVVIPTSVLEKNQYFMGNTGALGREIMIGRGKKAANGPSYTWDDFSTLQSASPLDPFGLPLLSLWSWPSWIPYLGKNQPNKNGPPVPEADKGKKRIWIASRTKVSFYATWWGYRLYLPPPVMKTLTSELGTAEKIAKVLSTVLSFLITHIPVALIPLPLIPLVTVLQAIAPLTGYLATFIAWSWGFIKSMDKGDGVVLSATWIVPVAIIPKAWDAPIVPDEPQAIAPGLVPPAVVIPAPSTPAVPAPAPLPVGATPTA
ncbi:hypothetical protein CF319_g7301 [Tilletia indica]|nr:hypothetical protein CF319_g7301 [Tilletia indica]